jgi:SAM-dependent methyltransferase
MEPSENEEPACPVCESRDSEVSQPALVDYEYRVLPKREFHYRLCRSCRSEYLFPRPSDEEVESFYPLDYHAYNDDHGGVAGPLVALRARARGRFYSKLAPGRRGSLFDVGAGDCRHFEELERFCDFEFSGVEIKAEIAARARERGYDIVTGTLEAMDVSSHLGRHDVVSMNHVIEHVVAPREIAARTYDLLRPGGLAIGQLPSVDCWERALFGRYWGGYHFPRHLQGFSREGLRGMLEEAGFTHVVVKSAPHLQAAISIENRLSARFPNLPHQLGRTRFYSALLLAVMPFEALACLAGRSGIIDFEARKPAG